MNYKFAKFQQNQRQKILILIHITHFPPIHYVDSLTIKRMARSRYMCRQTPWSIISPWFEGVLGVLERVRGGGGLSSAVSSLELRGGVIENACS